MITHFIEAGGNDFNHGKFMLGRLSREEIALRSALPGYETESLLRVGGLRRLNERSTLVVDLQTGEGATFFLSGYAAAELNKTQIWVCPMFEPFLVWLYQQGLGDGAGDITKLPRYVDLPDAVPEFRGHRRPGQPAASRSEARSVACPRCAAKPGDPCTGARGKPRESAHRERHDELERGGV